MAKTLLFGADLDQGLDPDFFSARVFFNKFLLIFSENDSWI